MSPAAVVSHQPAFALLLLYTRQTGLTLFSWRGAGERDGGGGVRAWSSPLAEGLPTLMINLTAGCNFWRRWEGWIRQESRA